MKALDEPERVLRHQTIKVSLIYYGRLVSYVSTLLFFYEVLKILIPVNTVASLSQIILFVLLLCYLVFLKLNYLQWYDFFKWYSTPGVIFLKSWTSLFFFSYLVQLPVQLGAVQIEQIISWLFQVCIGCFEF